MKENKKFIIYVLITLLAMIGLMIFTTYRNEKINNGTMIVIDHNAGDR